LIPCSEARRRVLCPERGVGFFKTLSGLIGLAVANRRKEVDEILIAQLGAGRSIETAAKEAGVCTKTVQRRLAEPAFRDRLHAYRADLLHRASGVLLDGVLHAGIVARKLLSSKNEMVQLGAVRVLISQAVTVFEKGELEERLRLEAAAAQQQPRTYRP
jgi:hypothetical protein